EIEVDRALLRERALRIEGIHDLPSGRRIGAVARAVLVQRHGAAGGQRGGDGGDGQSPGDARAHLMSFRRKKSHTEKSVCERAPGRLADLAVEYRQSLAYASVDRSHGQHAAAVLDGAVEHLHSIGSVAGGLIVRTVRQNLLGARIQGEACNPEGTVSASNVHQLLSIRRYPR